MSTIKYKEFDLSFGECDIFEMVYFDAAWTECYWIVSLMFPTFWTRIDMTINENLKLDIYSHWFENRFGNILAKLLDSECELQNVFERGGKTEWPRLLLVD